MIRGLGFFSTNYQQILMIYASYETPRPSQYCQITQNTAEILNFHGGNVCHKGHAKFMT